MHSDYDDAFFHAMQHLWTLREHRNEVQHEDGGLRGGGLSQYQEIQVC
jgi:hypothetical protein